MSNIKTKFSDFKRFMNEQKIPLREKLFYVVFGVTILGGITGAITCKLINSSDTSVMISFSLIMVYILLFLWGIYKPKYQEKLLISGLLGISFFIFPAMYLSGGSIKSGIPAYLVICLSAILFVIPRHSIPIAAVQTVFYFVIYYISYAYPSWVVETPAFATALGERTFNYSAVISNTCMATLVMGIMAKGVFKIYIRENNLVKSSIKEIERQSTIDPLTNIYNRRHMYKYLSQQVAKAQEEHTELSLAMFDIDKFKVLNDTYGHLLGDDVLKAISHILKNSCRENEIVARYGGEEFVLIMPGINNDEAFERADKIRDCIAKSYLSPELPKDKPVTVSGGVSTFRSGYDEEKLVAIADENLYASKETGRNKVTK